MTDSVSAWKIDTHDALTASDGVAALARTVLVLTDSLSGVGDLGQMLIDLGYRVQVALAVEGAVRGMPSTEPDAILCHLDRSLAEAPDILDAVRQHLQSPLIPVIGYLRADAERSDCFDSVIHAPAHPKQVAYRVDAMVRLQTMQHEVLRRVQVLQLGFGQAHQVATDLVVRQLRVLFIGKAKPEFMVILNALRARDVEVVAAFTSFTAFDYLHGKEFDAVIVDATESAEPALSILQSMSRNVRLYHMPKMLMTRKDGQTALPDSARALASDLIHAGSDTRELANRILEPAKYHRVHSQLRAEFDAMGDAGVRDADTGLFNQDYLRAYLDFLDAEGERRVVCRVKLVPDADYAVDPAFERVAMAQAGGLIGGLVRINDLVARMTPDEFAIAVPPMSARNLRRMMDRVVEVIECAAFESGKKGLGAFSMKADVRLGTLDEDGARAA